MTQKRRCVGGRKKRRRRDDIKGVGGLTKEVASGIKSGLVVASSAMRGSILPLLMM